MKYIKLALLALFIPSFTHAEWSQDDSPEMPAAEPNNRIIKWCEVDGKKTRFASANIKISGFEPCGKLEVISSCDASGNRLLSKGTKRPKGHLDCSKGPRILVISSKGETIEDASNQSTNVQPMNYREKKDLKYEMKKAVEKQNQDPQMQLQKALDGMLAGLLKIDPKTGKPSGTAIDPRTLLRSSANGTGNKVDMKTMMEQFKGAMNSLDPQTKKQLQNLLKGP